MKSSDIPGSTKRELADAIVEEQEGDENRLYMLGPQPSRRPDFVYTDDNIAAYMAANRTWSQLVDNLTYIWERKKNGKW